VIIIACVDPAEAVEYQRVTAAMAAAPVPVGLDGQPLRPPVDTDEVVVTTVEAVPATADGAVFLGEVGAELRERVMAALGALPSGA